MIALVGLPPTAGFVGKALPLQRAARRGKRVYLAGGVAVINSVISLYYYVRVLKVMYLDKAVPATTRRSDRCAASMAMLGVLAVATLLLGLPNFFGPLLNIAQNSLGTLARMLSDAGAGAIGGL